MIAKYKTINEQIEMLKGKQILIKNESQAKEILLRENYYNLIEGYEDIFIDIKNSKKNKTETYNEETYFEEIYAVYNFDRELRNLMFKYISIIEVHVKSYITDIFSKKYGTHNYLQTQNFAIHEGGEKNFTRLMNTIKDNINRNLENYPDIAKYKAENGSIPFWMLSTLITFGATVRFYSFMKPEDKGQVASILNMKHREMNTYLKMLNIVRNISAHGNVLFNTKLDIKYCCKCPDKFHDDFGIKKHNNSYVKGIDDMAAIIIVLRRFLNDKEYCHMTTELIEMIEEVKETLDEKSFSSFLEQMGIPRKYTKMSGLTQ